MMFIVASCVIDLSLEVKTPGKVVVWKLSPRN